ncbi:FAD-binding oxidoreductase [Aestuariivirga sp.]|uniref:NAD(P)/FAD-dependent oxidoreductase n=1 Tax=Aestuariivirga sp. TaxID=2650926 RepID=UPI0025C531A0|nr:FAD-binding oxidoreductase [Aestuariivirga sp.]MCA3555690.1 FAD-binding oxidoreductase [Aestuariivirga sp.]
MPQSIFAPSYYQATATPSPACPALSGDISADVCIVGAGYTGLSAAVELGEAGYKVVVLEAETVGHGASGRNGGQICTGFSSGQDKIAAQLGRDNARKCFAIAEEAKRLLVDRIRRYSIDCDLRWGYLHVLPKPNRMDGLKQWKDEWDDLGYTDTQLLDKKQLEERLGASAYHGALREGGAGHFHPLNYCLGLARAAAEAGAVIHEHSPAVEVDTGSRPFVRTAHGKVNARFTIIACNGYLGRLVPQLYGKVLPVTSYIIATEPLGENRARALIRDGEAVADTNFIVNYFRIASGTRMLFGGKASYTTMEPAQLAPQMKDSMVKIFPQLRDARIDFAWGGYIAITHNRIPDCGRLSPTAYYAHGYSGQGVALAGMYGKLIAEAVRGTAERFDLLSRVRHFPFPGGPVRVPLLAAAMLFYRIRDALS